MFKISFDFISFSHTHARAHPSSRRVLYMRLHLRQISVCSRHVLSRPWHSSVFTYQPNRRDARIPTPRLTFLSLLWLPCIMSYFSLIWVAISMIQKLVHDSITAIAWHKILSRHTTKTKETDPVHWYSDLSIELAFLNFLI